MQFMTGVNVGKGSLRCDLQLRIVSREAVSEKLEEDVRVLREMQGSTAGNDSVKNLSMPFMLAMGTILCTVSLCSHGS